MEHVNEKDLEFRGSGGRSGVKYLFRGPIIDWGVIVFAPGETLGRHFHERVEETFYFIDGKGGTMVINDERRPIRIGDAYRLNPTERHDIINDTDAPLRAVFIKSTYDPKDKVNEA
ncbi:MAG TPA: cupin domain-containing protein [Phycisphaerae bacterium]|nr:cupin domain-containing protein [Phycisphaerae bacterium]HOI54523.1 cupin domain-containing protein [Phycisphaerae bacterium]